MSKIYVVGIGPGSLEDMTFKAKRVLDECDLIVGYKKYIELIEEYFPGKEFLSTGMTKEVERAKIVLEHALAGKVVGFVSSGDSGIYGMAGLMLEIAEESDKKVPVEIVPGVTALSAGAAILGAPLMHDFSVISLSDLMTPWELIEKRLECAAKGDFVTGLYNPKSKNRSTYINTARDIFLKERSPLTPVGIVRNAGRKDENYTITNLNEMLNHEIDMFTIVIIGNSKTYIKDGHIITPRGYSLGEEK